ncbi:MAG: hypothetical protein GTO53_01450 [Planctomycetales bacterium]|nr:hypothetical protein [Planctomycetales bacterium]NIM07837.1 hypothetical protein [Planctomycetales bacterium]NIN07329.1 hypothetical protein [Planctomycetales bacterium]NIN76432.1 hypothetical protein [Planctomycetales bacterium]NIO33630.1 hypothetical protein [Planctomycetales bacterium]
MVRRWFPGALLVALMTVASVNRVVADEPPRTGAEGVNQAFPVPRPEPVDPPSPADLQAALTGGVDFLLNVQVHNGAWGSPRRTKGMDVYAPVPGAHHAFRAATTALCLMALIESGDSRPEVQRAIQRGQAWWLAHGQQVRRADGVALYNVWAHAYGIQALLKMQSRAAGQQDDSTATREPIQKAIQHQIRMLDRYESVNGGWGYYDFSYQLQKPSSIPTCFTTATCLIALLQARQAGYEVQQRTIQRAVEAINRQRKADFSYLYSGRHRWYPMFGINRPAGSLGRSQVCNLALRMSGDERVTDQVLIDWLDRLFARNLWLDIGRKRPIPHESYFGVAGYFFYYGHYYASLCIEQLPAAQRPQYQAMMARLLLGLQEKDGSWWDFPLYDYHQPYGTAMAVMSLIRCRAAEKQAANSSRHAGIPATARPSAPSDARPSAPAD